MRFTIQTGVVALFLAVTLLFSSQHANAEEAFTPDRCPEPCEVGGTHVSLDYQRLTTPMRIRNAASGNYLKLDGNSVSVEPLVENDDSFLWVMLPG
ncbi:MAG: hypothetical protein JKY99_12790, partial [Rhizobiales bacterium]|nr:hypothetical protein [Hyphomicrobiales bacterium]